MTETKIHDYTNETLGWGHNYEMFHETSPGSGIMSGFVFGKPRLGEEMRWSTAYGTAVGEFTEVTWTRNVDDMYEVQVEVRRRYDHEDYLLDNETGERVDA